MKAEADPIPPDNTALVSPAIDTNYNRKRRLEEDETADDSKSQQRQIALPGKSSARKSDSSSELSTVLGYLSVDENMTMRYHGPTSGLHLMTASRVFVSPFWHFSNPGFWPRSKRTTFRTEDEIVSAADAILGGILPAIPLQNKLLELVSYFDLSSSHFLMTESNLKWHAVRIGHSSIHASQSSIERHFSSN